MTLPGYEAGSLDRSRIKIFEHHLQQVLIIHHLSEIFSNFEKLIFTVSSVYIYWTVLDKYIKISLLIMFTTTLGLHWEHTRCY